ncbi:MAG TPA: 2-oxo-4-hydroxy-4-carboxy-5-ureidoimidazoline decarboxylase [Casimicrobiaceae bacterium]|nr:2-oxo-4-hydroxy-4-carboxy-5-ureidoimidazoline decarboxylase [Casimicrobiaceae bacterium]
MNIDSVNRVDRAAFISAFGEIFEHSPWVAERTCAARPFASIDALHVAMVNTVKAAPQTEQLALLRAHPDLAGKEAAAGTMTSASVTEQSTAGLDNLSRAELAQIGALNAAYRAKHGFPFIIAVRHYTKAGIFYEFARRIGNDSETEFTTALEQVFAIARLRLARLVESEVARSTI